MKRLVLLCVLLTAGAPLQAAEAEPPPEEEAAPRAEGAAGEATEQDEDETAAAEDAGEEGAEAAVTLDDTFIPSTQISEDLSVSFPVDI